MIKRFAWAAAALGMAAAPAAAQQSQLGAACNDVGLPRSARETCITVAQAVESAQPQLGIVLTGGNPTLGTASTGGIRLGILPRVSATAKANLVFVRLPDILAESAGSAAQTLNDATGIPVPALSGTASVGVFPGISLAPTVGGVGAVDLLGSATWLPLGTFDVEGFSDDTPDFSWGGGARVGLLRESFTMPGLSVSLMYHSLGTVSYGDVCDQPAPLVEGRTGDGYRGEAGLCLGGGDPGEFTVDLSNWSTRGAISKRLLGLGLTAGVGYDRFSSDAGFGLRTRCPLVNSQTCFARFSGFEVDNDRWSGFVNGSFSLLMATFAAEVGWMEGGDPIEGFPSTSDFDPGSGTFFGSLGFRLAL
ncbi:MAG TPA: hypothetical protein VGV85_00620 [Longimicrobiaceae bacterium]|nr:hypothetical protein [Longimicrobiaceae bacterium]